MDTVVKFTLLATIVEGLAEYLFAGWDKEEQYIKYIALALGVLVSMFYQLDLLKDFFGLVSPVPFVGSILTGLLIGRGSNFVNDLSERWLKPPP